MSASSGGGARTPVTVPDPDAASGEPSGPVPRAESERYVIEREIGRGGMGRVFEARDLRLQRPVAIKMLRARDSALVARFEREVKLAARLQHPGIVPVYDAGFWPSGEPYLVMKHVLGQSLARVIRDAETPAERLALLPHVITAAEAVAFAHDQSVVHRDLKPINILVGAFGETIVLDWGSPRICARPGETSPRRLRLSGRPRRRPSTPPRAPCWARRRTWRPSKLPAGRRRARRRLRAGRDLYHLLAGTAPHPPLVDGEERTAGAAAACPRAARAARGMAAVRPARHRREGDGDRSQARYPTAFELAEDFKRFQAGQLVAARSYSAPTARGALRGAAPHRDARRDRVAALAVSSSRADRPGFRLLPEGAGCSPRGSNSRARRAS
jgi:hypothetical protein